MGFKLCLLALRYVDSNVAVTVNHTASRALPLRIRLATAGDKRRESLSQFRQFRIRKGWARLPHGRIHVARPQKHLGHLSFDREIDVLRNVARHLGDAESIELLHYDAKKSATLIEQRATAVAWLHWGGDLQLLEVVFDAPQRSNVTKTHRTFRCQKAKKWEPDYSNRLTLLRGRETKRGCRRKRRGGTVEALDP